MSMNETDTPDVSNPSREPLSEQMREYWGIIVRRKWFVFASIVAGVVIAVVLSVVLPKSYRSSTLILIENQKIPEDYVKGIGGASLEQRLTLLQQQVMSRTILSQILDEYELYERQVKREGLESAIETFRKMIKVETVGTPGAWGKSVESVTLSFAHEDPATAMHVTAKLASLFIEENVKVREQLVTGVSVFLEQELLEAQKSLEAQEEAISKYKTKYMGQLPEQMEANLRTLDRLQTELNATKDSIHSRTDKLGSLEMSINEYQVTETTHVKSNEPRTTRRDIDPLVVRLRELERRLTTLRAEWKETYPDIWDTKQEILRLKEQLAEKYGVPFVDQDGEADMREELRPDLYMRELNTHRSDLLTELSSLKERHQRLLQLIKETERRVEQTPAREQELMILVRDYENMKKNYQALLDKRLNAHVAENLEKRQQGEQFRILDPANLPQKPEKPNRLMIMILGLIGGCGLGVGLAVGLEQLNPTFRRREEIEVLPGIHVLATVPQFFILSHQISAMPKAGLRVAGGESPRVPPLKIAANGNGNGLKPENLNLVAKWQPRSIAAEQYRMAATKLVLSTEGRHSTVVEITSALMGEGKTTTVVNLGYTIARDFRKKTLFIDCDFQRPALHHYAKVPARAGLIEFLDGQTPLDDCLSVIDECPCFILAVGGAGGESNELGRIQQLRAILPELRAQFQYLIINTPPVLASATMGILASLADELVWVIRAGYSPKHLVQKAFAMLGPTVQRQVILNGLDAQSMPHHLYGYTMSYGRDLSIERARQ